MFSIAMTTYNGEKFISEQIDSIIAQTEKDFELVICDDCSKDKTFEILKSYIKKDSRIKIFQNSSNLGYLKNFEKAITLCSGDFIALSDQDDIWLPNHLRILLETIKKENCSLVGGNAWLVDADNKDLECQLINNKNFPTTKLELEKMILYRNIFQGATILFEKDILQTALPFPEKVRFHDWWLALVASEEKGVFYIDEPILRYRQHGNNVSGKHNKDSVAQKIKKMFAFDLTDGGHRCLSVLVPFLAISKKKEKVSEIIQYSNNCIDCRFSALSYFSKHYNEIYFNENLIRAFARKIKVLLNIMMGKIMGNN